MKSSIRILLFFLATFGVLVLAGCVPVVPIFSPDQGLVVGRSYHLASGDTLNHDLTVIGGNASLDQNSTINGSLSVIGGNVTVDGNVNGNISVIGSDVSLEDHANVLGTVESLGGTVQQSSQATVQGKKVDQSPTVPNITTLRSPLMQVSFDPITGPLMAIFQALALAALAVIVNLFAAAYMERAGRAAIATPAASGGVGCLTILVLVVMAVTIILIPISVLGLLAVAVAALFGWLALGLLVGRQVAVWLKQTWTDPINAGVGTLAISLLVSLLNIIPCIGWVAGALAWLVALGAVVLTRFGTQIYPSPYPVASVAHPGAYPPPTYPSPQPGARVYPPDTDQPGENPPAGPESNNNA